MQKKQNIIVIITLLIGAFVLCLFIAKLLSSSPDAVAQALGNLVGSAIGVLGAFGAAWWVFDKKEIAKSKRYNIEKNLIRGDLRNYSSSVVLGEIFALSALREDIASSDNSYGPNDFDSFPSTGQLVRRHLDYNLFSEQEITTYEALQKSAESYENSYGLERRNKFPTPDERSDNQKWQISYGLSSFNDLKRYVQKCCEAFEVEVDKEIKQYIQLDKNDDG